MKEFHPPRFVVSILRWFCKDELLEEISGDLEEECSQVANNQSIWRAKIHYTVSVLLFVRPFAIKKRGTQKFLNMGLLANYLKIGWRVLLRDKKTMLVGFTSLFLAFLTSLIIVMVVKYETGYDAFHENGDRIYRVTLRIEEDGGRVRHLANVGPPLGPEIKNRFPEVENSVRFRYKHTVIVSTGDREKSFYENKIFYADPSIFEVFTFPLRYGDVTTALQNKESVVLTLATARKYFGDQNPLGELIYFGEEGPFEVTGVMEPIRENHHLKFDFLLPFQAFEVPFGYPVTLQSWGWSSFHTYVLLKEGVDPAEFESKMPEFAASHFDTDRPRRFYYGMQPLEEIYFGEYLHEDVVSGDRSNVLILLSVAVLIMLLSGFNFANIATAQSLSRGKETGIRKSIGSSSGSLWIRYLSEPVLVAGVAFILASLLVEPILSVLATRFNFPQYWDLTEFLNFLPRALLVCVLIGLLAGSYPAFVMSRYKVTAMMRGQFKTGGIGAWLRLGLVGIQFVITSFLITGSFIVQNQISYLANKDLGFDSDHLAVLRVPGELLIEKFPVLRTELLQHTRIDKVAIGGGRLDGDQGNVPIIATGHEQTNMHIMGAKHDFFSTIGADFVSGRDFSTEHPSDSAEGIIVNESFLDVYGWTAEEALGKNLQVGSIMNGNIVGVVSNFNFESLREDIQPVVAYFPRTYVQDVYIELQEGDPVEMAQYLENVWYDVLGDVPFEMVYLDQHLSTLYVTDRLFATLIRIFSLITVFIAVIGLFGLIALICRQKIKEIGIRKVLGAGEHRIVFHLSKGFLMIILIANVIAWPLVFRSIELWLANFAYQVQIGFLPFALTLGITLLVSFLTLYAQTRNYAQMNPVHTLRDE